MALNFPLPEQSVYILPAVQSIQATTLTLNGSTIPVVKETKAEMTIIMTNHPSVKVHLLSEVYKAL